MNLSGIGEIARKAGIAASAIRYYERIGLLPPPPRISGKRRYDDSILPKLGLIRLAQAAGLSIAEIQKLLHDFPTDTPPSARWSQLASGKIAELSALIDRIERMKQVLETTLACACPTLDECGATAMPCVMDH